MIVPFNMMNRRQALATLGSAGLGLLAMQLPPVYADEVKQNAVSTALAKVNEKSRQRLLRILKEPGFSGCIPSAEVKALCDGGGRSIDAVMIELLPLARTYSQPPISNFYVGAVARGTSGNLYLGANMEFPGHSLGFSVHGEQSALSNAYMHSDRGISSIAVTAAPCGHCRQFMNELSPDGDIQVLVEGKPAVKLFSLLPSAFGPKDLGVEDLAFPVREVDLILPKGPSDALTLVALDAARKSYAPYTKAHSGVALATRTGLTYEGAYIENAAYNPSLPPLQTALVALLTAGESYSAISEVALVEMEGAPISQKSAAEAVLSAIAPGVKLRVLSATMRA
jgi:cytidine deaminase